MKIAGSVMYMYVQHGRLNKWAVSGVGGVVVKLIGLTIQYILRSFVKLLCKFSRDLLLK